MVKSNFLMKYIIIVWQNVQNTKVPLTLNFLYQMYAESNNRGVGRFQLIIWPISSNLSNFTFVKDFRYMVQVNDFVYNKFVDTFPTNFSTLI